MSFPVKPVAPRMRMSLMVGEVRGETAGVVGSKPPCSSTHQNRGAPLPERIRHQPESASAEGSDRPYAIATRLIYPRSALHNRTRVKGIMMDGVRGRNTI